MMTCRRMLRKHMPWAFEKTGAFAPRIRRKCSTMASDRLNSRLRTTEKQNFLAMFPDIVSSVTDTDKLKELPEATEWIQKLLEYNSAGGNKIRGLMTTTAYQMLEKPENITEESMRQAHILGWAVEILQTCMLVLDDVIDQSSTRRGAPCWYKLPGVGLRALNDSSALLTVILDILKVNFREELYYANLIDIFNEAISQICIGQHLDSISARNYDRFTQENYNKIAIYKTVYYTYKLPIHAGLLISTKMYEDSFKHIEDLVRQMGILTLMQNDFVDCFGDEALAGKAGNDIQEGKCTWLAVTALQRCSDAQRAEFVASYGSADAARLQRVKRLYESLHLPELYREAERTTYNNIVTRLEALPADNAIPSSVLLKLFHIVYQLHDNLSVMPKMNKEMY